MMLNEVKRMVKEQKNTSNNVFESIVIGGGPAGLTAGLYLSRYRIDVASVSYTHLDVYKRQGKYVKYFLIKVVK